MNSQVDLYTVENTWKRILQWLTPPNSQYEATHYEDVLKKVLDVRTNSMCLWLIQHQTFQTWLARTTEHNVL